MHIAHRWPLTKGVVAKITFKMGKYLNVPPQEWALVDTIDVYGGVDFSLVNAEIPLGERERDTHTHVDIIWFPYINAMATYCCYYFSAHKAWLWPCCLCRSFRRFGLKLHQRWDSASREKAAADLRTLCWTLARLARSGTREHTAAGEFGWSFASPFSQPLPGSDWKGKHSGSAFELGMDCTQTACCWDSMDHFLPSFSWLRISCESCFPHSEALHSYMSYVVYKHYFRKKSDWNPLFLFGRLFLEVVDSNKRHERIGTMSYLVSHHL
jgi:hypothetical protein